IFYDKTKTVIDSRLRTATTTDDNLSDNGFMHPLLDSPMATGGDETRPKSLVLKLCIKALNSFDDVVFWIKSHGEVTNAGALDAGRLAQGLQDKADRNHTHTVSQITDFNQSVREIVTQSIAQNLAETGWCKLPNGMILQWGLAVLNRGYGRTTDTYITFPIRFPSSCFNVVMSYGVMTDKRVTQDPVLASLDQTGVTVRQQSDRDIVIYWRAIGV
ncbi:phage tail repeat domain-containing protein, partial [Haemophilus influenzae]|nr:phage tail repeat domain-containing protein [Haemophilus influenzae]MCK9093251.1 phage tail repeat domain-containing protein [Haemophilus influenzae]